jgi:two-component system OmpR family sensor kinase
MSLRSRLLAALSAAVLLALLGAGIATYSSLRDFLYQRVDESLASIEAPAGRGQGRPGGPGGPGGPGPRSDIGSAGRGAFVQRRAADGSITVTQVPRDLQGQEVTLDLPDDISAGAGGPRVRYLTVGSSPNGTSWRVRASAVPDPPGGTLLVALPLDDVEATLSRLVVVQIGVAVAALAAAAAIGWWLVRLGLRPLAQIEATAEAIAAGQLERRVPGDEKPTEVGRLAAVLNRMLARIEAAFAARDATEAELRRSEDRMRRFVADASHELRTPLAAVSAYAELFDRGASGRPEDLARSMTGIRTETTRMGELVEDLLLLARLDEGRPVRSEPVELVALAAEAVAAARAVGPAWPVQLRAVEPVEVLGDASRLRQVLDNLLANARAHTPPGTNVTVTVRRADGSGLLEVADDGPGLTDDQAARVFERFYRADPSRSRRHGGAGLGLSIVAAIVKAHGGDVRAQATPGQGAAFTVRLPAQRTAGSTA